MENPISSAKTFLTSLENTLKLPFLKGKNLDQIQSLTEFVKIAIETLESIDAHVSLDYEVQQIQPQNSFLLWQSIAEGAIRDTETLESLIKGSLLLKSLHQKGINIPAIYKYSKEETARSMEIGEIYFKDHDLIDGIRRALVNHKVRKGHFRVQAGNFITALSYLKKLHQYEVIEAEWFISKNIIKDNKETGKKEYSWKEIDENHARMLKEKVPKLPLQIDISYGQGNGRAYRQILDGEWFNAYTYQIIAEHLGRNEFDFEIYTRVNYVAPRDIFAASGDFDVLARVNKTILLVECKSGNNLDEEEISRFAIKSAGLKEVFEATGVENYHFLFVYNPVVDLTPQIEKQLADANIQPLRINELRKEFIAMFAK